MEEFGIRSSTYFKLEKQLDDTFVSVYEFHTVVNNNRYYREREERIAPDGSRHDGWYGKPVKFISRQESIDEGNKLYRKLLANGYKLVGKYEMDRCGYSRPLKENS